VYSKGMAKLEAFTNAESFAVVARVLSTDGFVGRERLVSLRAISRSWTQVGARRERSVLGLR